MTGLGEYSLEMFGRMFVDGQRHHAYLTALEEAVKPGDVVLDIGTGIGIYAMLAARLGAKMVYAVEVNPLVGLGRQLATSNGLADRIQFIEALSTEIDLPEQADVIVADLRGVLPYFDGNIPSLRDATARHLAPGGVLLPALDKIMAAPASNKSGAEWYSKMWLENRLGLDLRAAADLDANKIRRDRVGVEDLLTEPVIISTIDYSDLTDTGFAYEGTVRTIRSGRVDGLSLWFEATVLDDASYSTGPDSPETVYGMAFLPFRYSVDLELGADLRFAVSARLVDDDYVWSWSASAADLSGVEWRAAQSTFRAAPIDPDRVARRKAGHRPSFTSSQVDADLLTLQLLRDRSTLGEAAARLAADFPDVAPDGRSALARVADLAGRYER